MRIAEGQALAVALSDRCAPWHIVTHQEEPSARAAAWISASGRGRDRGKTPETLRAAVAEELADLFPQVLFLAERAGIGLGDALLRKWGHHLETRPA
ncbi:hypothetical protein [Maritimibacter sp. HL-12]|uniref:hypothetical protein n=1 Tax=Maritimibacter sp. HL-12 TaxID=1162418 RepID=UPI000A0F27E6|nr:hypothetical protein [Maritimibacter sp. HL-12]SMH34728.1 hypothetical protein SAMN05661107_0550 [Maritimibacter sp. HL-12]